MLAYMDIQMDSQESSKQHKMSCRLALDTINDLYCILETLYVYSSKLCTKNRRIQLFAEIIEQGWSLITNLVAMKLTDTS